MCTAVLTLQDSVADIDNHSYLSERLGIDKRIGILSHRQLNGTVKTTTAPKYTFEVQTYFAFVLIGLWGLLLIVMVALCCNHRTGCLGCSCCSESDDTITFREPIYIAGSNPYGNLINKIQEKYKVDNFDNGKSSMQPLKMKYNNSDVSVGRD